MRKILIALCFVIAVFSLIPFSSCTDEDEDDIEYPTESATFDRTGSITIGDEVRITVTSDGLGQDYDPTTLDTYVLEVYVFRGNTGLGESLTLTETEVDSKIFTAEFSTAYDQNYGFKEDGIAYGVIGDELTFYYSIEDSAGPSLLMAGGVAGTITVAEVSTLGDPLMITVTDSDLNEDESVADVVDITVTSDLNETETVTLTETGVNTGIFEGTLPIAIGSLAGTDNDGSIIGKSGTVITAIYDDVLDEEFADPDPIEASVTLPKPAPGTTGTIAIAEVSKLGDALAITVTDADINTNESAADEIQVTVTSSLNETETVTLTETGISTGIFEGTLEVVVASTAGTDENGSINGEGGTVITATYDDALDANADDPDPVDNSVTLPELSIGVVFFDGDEYTLHDDFTSVFAYDFEGTYYLTLAMGNYDGEVQGLGISFEMYSDTELITGTYTFDGDPSGFSDASEVSINNGGSIFSTTGGTVELTVEEDGSRTIEISVTTESGNLTGRHNFPSVWFE